MEIAWHIGQAPSLKGFVLSQEDSLKELLRSQKSLIRFGDGEATIMEGGHIYFQRNTPELARRVRDIMREYGPESPYLIAVPPETTMARKRREGDQDLSLLWRKARFVFSDLLPDPLPTPLLDAMIFREDSRLPNSEIAYLWAESETIYFVHSNYKYFSDFNATLTDRDVRFVNLYGANAYRNIERVLSDITQHAETLEDATTSAVALVSGGPAGKVIVAELAARGLRAIDCGHYFDYKYYDLRRDSSKPS